MKEVDDKLKEILSEYSHAWTDQDGDVLAAGDKAIAAIYQAFTEAGGLVGNVSVTNIHSINGDSNIMTGQEWYQKFRKEVTGLAVPYKHGERGLAQETFSVMVEAAKRAAGLDT